MSRADPRCGGIWWRRRWRVQKGSPSMKNADPRADAAPESVTTLESAANGRRDRFSTINTRWRECAGCHAQSARVSGSDGATAQAACVPWVSGDTDGCTHHDVGTGGRRGRSFDHREAAARIEPVDVRTCMRMPVRLYAKEYRFETSGEMWHGESCGYRRMSS